MNLNKHLEFFDPTTLNCAVHIIGCGAIGSTIAEMLARLGVAELSIYDFDVVSEHNITNQMYRTTDIGKTKCEAISSILKDINPDIEVHTFEKGWTENTKLSGIVFLAVDNIETRKAIVQTNKYNPYIKAMFDVRMRLTDAQHFAASWTTENIDRFFKTMDFTHEEAQANAPVSACGTSLSVTPTVRMVCSVAVSNFINFWLKKPLAKMILVDAFRYTIDAFYETQPSCAPQCCAPNK